MTLLKWTKAFSVGIEEVDKEHRDLIEMINGLHDVMQMGADYVQVVELLGEIYSQIATHFAHEEKIMRNARYALYEEHKEDHETLLDELRDFMDEVDADGAFDAGGLSADLSRWFSDHFQTHDVKLFRAL